MNKKSLMGVKVLGALALILIAVGVFITRQQLVAPPAEAFGVLDKTDPSGVHYWSALGSGGKDANIGVRYDYESRGGVLRPILPGIRVRRCVCSTRRPTGFGSL